AECVLAEHKPRGRGVIVDIGSNVGTLLSHFKDLGHPNVQGVEPATNIANIAIKNGVPTINDFFGASVVKALRDAGGVEVLLSSNVVNHADDLRGLLKTASDVLHDDGVF